MYSVMYTEILWICSHQFWRSFPEKETTSRVQDSLVLRSPMVFQAFCCRADLKLNSQTQVQMFAAQTLVWTSLVIVPHMESKLTFSLLCKCLKPLKNGKKHPPKLSIEIFRGFCSRMITAVLNILGLKLLNFSCIPVALFQINCGGKYC